MQQKEILIHKFLNNSISAKEKEDLKLWVNASSSNMILLKKEIKKYGLKKELNFNVDEAQQKFFAQIKPQQNTKTQYNLYKYAAAIIGLIIAFGFVINNYISTSEDTIIVNKEAANIITKGDIIITLADGTQKIINTQNNAVIKDVDGNTIASKNANTITFTETKTSITKKETYNKIYIPFGEKLKILLSDGTQVWLNSGSTFRFPQEFNSLSKNRLVYLDGEAFFDVTKNKEKPFIVNAQEVNIKVLGTQFNLSSYTSDKTVVTTLVEGAVNVFETDTPENELELKPNFQATYSKNKNSFSKKQVDTDIYTSWMNGKLIIDGLQFSAILKKLERLHGVSIINKAENLNHEIYKGEFENENISTILKTIALSTPFKFSIDQNTITITE